ncbi:MAG: hypothetical protein ACI395_04850 [Candidatus Cryptobacteroides sp.]
MNKLQELTDKLYNEGLSKGKQEGEAILENARTEAGAIVEAARKEAEQIIAAARKEAEGLRTKVTGDLKLAAEQSIAATKQDIENLIVTKLAGADVKTALSSADFVKEVVLAVAKGFKDSGAEELEVVLPESLKKDLEPFVKKELGKILGEGVSASFSKKVGGGFKVSPKGAGYFISFTDETFNELISEYLRPATKKILFG